MSSTNEINLGVSSEVRYWPIEDAFRVKKEVFTKFHPFQKHEKVLASLRMRYYEMYYKGELPEMTEEEANRLALCVCLQGIKDFYSEGKAINREEISDLPQENIPIPYIGIALGMPPSVTGRDWLTIIEQVEQGCVGLLANEFSSFMTFRKGKKFDPFKDDFQVNLFLLFFKGNPSPVLHERLTTFLTTLRVNAEKLSDEGWYEYSEKVSTYLTAWLGLTLSSGPLEMISKDKVATFEDLAKVLYTPGAEMNQAALFWDIWTEFKKRRKEFKDIRDIHACRVRSLMALSYMYTTCDFPVYFKAMEDEEDDKRRQEEKKMLESMRGELEKAKLRKNRKQDAEMRSIIESLTGMIVTEPTSSKKKKKRPSAVAAESDAD